MDADVGKAEDAQHLPGVVDHAVLHGDVADERTGVVLGEDAEMGDLAEVGAGGVLGEGGLEQVSNFGALGRGEEVIGEVGDVHLIFLGRKRMGGGVVLFGEMGIGREMIDHLKT